MGKSCAALVSRIFDLILCLLGAEWDSEKVLKPSADALDAFLDASGILALVSPTRASLVG